MEQRYQAVLAVVQDGSQVSESPVAWACLARASTHGSLATRPGGLGALADRSHKPATCPHQADPEIEAEICELRRLHPGWGPRRIEHQLHRMGLESVPSRSAIYTSRATSERDRRGEFGAAPQRRKPSRLINL
jgi:hypothetical protein